MIHAISAAAIMDEITHQCLHNKTPGCDCPKELIQYNGREVVILRCSHNIKFGEKEAGRFTDRLETRLLPLKVVNRHNNRVGREVTYHRYF